MGAPESKHVRLIRKQLDAADPTPVDAPMLRSYAWHGISDAALRPALWKVFLHCASENKFWAEAHAKRRRDAYADFAATAPADPAVAADVDRAVVFPVRDASLRTRCAFLDAPAEAATHRDAVKRILCVFAATHPAIAYVQGMHAVAIVLYHVLRSEADAFFCFVALAAQHSAFFATDFADDAAGVAKALKRVFAIVADFDSEVAVALAAQRVAPSVIFKWVGLAFAGEFAIDDVVWLWDRFLSDDRGDIVAYCAAAKVVLLRSRIVGADFAAIVAALLHSADVDAFSMFFKADEMRGSRRGPKKCTNRESNPGLVRGKDVSYH